MKLLGKALVGKQLPGEIPGDHGGILMTIPSRKPGRLSPLPTRWTYSNFFEAASGRDGL